MRGVERVFYSDTSQEDFNTRKKEVLNFLYTKGKEEDLRKLSEFNKGEIDDGVRDIVNKLNELPFLYTTLACGGHKITRKSIKYPDAFSPRENEASYRSGGIHFETNKSTESQEFIKRLKKLVNQFEGATLYNRPFKTDQEEYQNLPYFALGFGKTDKNNKNISISEAGDLEIEREEFKKEFKKLIKEFLQPKE
ncbi:hypothetical protein KKC67_00630 [Patescibacteria group bacterium]|nr:hypothetical protein [Patescibacteria group bacterium]MBU0879613.1 hypothetical protein [Patescibacteria group bacterium]MBU0879953.1 hypothetical protein [Patescibacteria group bacterium]MBU0897707.1 hypothetical protein [Patescibacteria group bacterium]MBU1991503.1 hypothetical protein [Patescibacteria group bacterium]